ncbi:MAG: GLPGLI family protein [Oceanihabitans sp.]|nr:GLPGLI family protein [Oceanihabitans sp.]
MITRKEFANHFFLIESELSNYDWKITNEIKTIENFTCYKATRITQSTLPKNQKKVDVVITAWFCPKLSYSSGPIGNYGLPGVILQLNNGNKIVYYAKKIEITENNLAIEIPSKGDKVSEKKINEIVREFVDR